MAKSDVLKIAKSLGNKALRERLGLTQHSIRHARTTGEFPASWFNEIDTMCREAGIECPRAAFKWRVSST